MIKRLAPPLLLRALVDDLAARLAVGQAVAARVERAGTGLGQASA